MIKKPLSISFFLLFALICSAQELESVELKGWSLGIGYSDYGIQDLNASPLTYRANNGYLECNYSKKKQQTLYELGLSLSVGSNQSVRFGKREAEVFDDFTVHGERDTFLYVLNPGLSFIQADLHYTWLDGHGVSHEGVGLPPDVVVQNSKSDILNGKDEALEAAVLLLKE